MPFQIPNQENQNVSRRLVGRSVFALFVLAASCAGPGGSSQRAAELAGQRAGQRVRWEQNHADAQQDNDAVRALLRGPLTAERAVQIALLNNRQLQASFEDVGVAQADVIQAGLLSNPNFSASFRFPNRPPSGTNIEYSVAQNFLELLLIPLRKRIAAERLAQLEAATAQTALRLAADVKIAYYTAQARQVLLERLLEISQTSQLSADFTQRLYDAGNTSELSLLSQQGSYEESRSEVAQTELQLSRDRERVSRLLGISGGVSDWKLAFSLPDLPKEKFSISRLEERALTQRLDLQAARTQVNLAGEALALRSKTRFVPVQVRLGADTEKEPDGSRVTGPTLDLELPIFDQGQGEIARLTAQYRKAQQELAALTNDVRSEVRDANNQVLAARKLASEISVRLLPGQKNALRLTLQEYNYMLKSPNDLLLAKRNLLAAQRSYLEALRDYWVARAELEFAVGGSLRGSPTLSEK